MSLTFPPPRSSAAMSRCVKDTPGMCEYGQDDHIGAASGNVKCPADGDAKGAIEELVKKYDSPE